MRRQLRSLVTRSAPASVLPLAVPLLLVAACGYSLAGRGAFLPSHIKTIGVPQFVNSTPFFEVEELLTQKVRTEFVGRGRYQVLPQDTGVDAVLRGEILSITLTPASFTGQEQASRYIIVLVVKIQFTDVKTDKVLWENAALEFRDEYDVATGGDALDPTVFFGQQSNAVERVAADFAKTVVSALLEAF